MQQQPTGYGSNPQWYGQPQQSPPPSEQWSQQSETPYPSQQGFAPQQPYQPQQGQFQQPYTPNPQWNQQPNQQKHTPEQQQVKQSVPFTVGLIAALVLIACAVGFAFLGHITSSSTPSSTLSEPDYKASTTDTTVSNLDKDSNQDKGKNVHFTSTILNFVKDSNGTAGANVDSGLSSGVIQVIFPSGTDLSQLNAGDAIEVWGVDEGSFSGTNAFGATIQEVGIGAIYMTDQTTGYQTT